MRLLYLCSDFGITPSGTKGASVHLREITRALSDAGHEVLLLSPKDGPDESHPVERVLPPGCPLTDKAVKPLKRYLAQRELGTDVAKELRPLLYNTWVTDPALEALAERPPDLILERLSLFGHVGLDLSEKLDVPLVVEVNAPLSEEATQYRSLQMKELALEIEQRVLNRADAVVVVSKALAHRLARRGLDPRKVHVVPNGADVSRFAGAPSREVCRQALGIDNRFVVGFVGSLKEWHGVDVLLEAFGMLHQEDGSARLLIAGKGPAEERLREQAAVAGLGDAVTFTGAVPHDRVPTLLRAMDVAVAPFRSMPGFYFSPIKLFEYMAAATCVVASRVGQIAEVVEDGVNGVLVHPDDEQDLFQKLRELRDSPERRLSLGADGLKTVQQQYTWSRAADALTQVMTAASRGPATVQR